MGRGGRSGGMGRSSSRGRSTSPPPRSTSTATRPMQPPPVQAPMQQATGGSMLGGIGSTIVQGMAFGAGSEVAHQAVRSVMGGSSHKTESSGNV